MHSRPSHVTWLRGSSASGRLSIFWVSSWNKTEKHVWSNNGLIFSITSTIDCCLKYPIPEWHCYVSPTLKVNRSEAVLLIDVHAILVYFPHGIIQRCWLLAGHIEKPIYTYIFMLISALHCATNNFVQNLLPFEFLCLIKPFDQNTSILRSFLRLESMTK